jgi:hypothetical protein
MFNPNAIMLSNPYSTLPQSFLIYNTLYSDLSGNPNYERASVGWNTLSALSAFDISIQPVSGNGGPAQYRDMYFITGPSNSIYLSAGTVSNSGNFTTTGNGSFGAVNNKVNIGNVNTGYYGDSLNLALRPPSGGAIYFQTASGTTTNMVIDSSGSINAVNNPIYNCPTTAKAWVSFNGTYNAVQGANLTTVTFNVQTGSTSVTANKASHGLVAGVGFTISGETGSLSSLNGAQTVDSIGTTTNTLSNFFFTTTTPSTVTKSVTGSTTILLGGTIYDQYNVSSITKNGTGDFTVNFTTPLNNTYYTVAGSSKFDSSATAEVPNVVQLKRVTSNPATTGVRIATGYSTAAANYIAYDNEITSVVMFGN